MIDEIKITIDDLFELPNAAVYNSDSYKPATNVSMDSRKYCEEFSLYRHKRR